MDNPCFFQTSFFSTKCAPFLLKIEKDFNIDDQKGFELMNLKKNQFEHIWLKSVFDLKNYSFENVPLTKNIHIYVIENMNA
jgi:hypothetical protein